MKKLLVKILISGAILFIFFVLIVLSIGKAPFDRYIEQQLISLAQSQGIRLSLKQTSFGLSGMHAETGEAFLAKALVLLPFNRLAVTPHYAKLLRAIFGATIQAEIAKGNVDIDIAQGANNRIDLTAALVDMQLSEFPTLAFLGFNNGKATVHLDEFALSPHQIESGKLSIAASDIGRAGGRPLQFKVSGFPLTIDLPEITKGTLDVTAEAETNQIVVKKLDCTSSLLSFSGDGELHLNEKLALQTVSFKAEVHLTPDGQAAFRAFLPLISQNALKLDTQSFSFEVTGTVPQFRTRFVDLAQ